MTSSQDVLYVDVKKGLEVDFDDKEEISSIQNIIADDKYFYVLANKKSHKLGYYLLQIEINNPNNVDYLISWNNKLDIGNCDIHMMQEELVQG